MQKSNKSSNKKFNTIVVGAGSAGVGVSIVLKKMGIDYVILEKDEVGSSFRKWPKESRLISPSFTGNFFNMPDLNAISPETSPAFNLRTEHPTGLEYAHYLDVVSYHYKLKIHHDVDVLTVAKNESGFTLFTNEGNYEAKYLIWAAGEYQYPKRKSFEGSELCKHFSDIASFSNLEGEERIVIGGYESGFDTVINLIKAGKKATLIDSSNYLEMISSDSSYALSPFTRDRIDGIFDHLKYYENTRAVSVEFDGGSYTVITSDGEVLESKHKPINCTGFDTSISLVRELFDHNEKYPLVSEVDESTKTENLFLVGPQVKHRNALFCFIYKYRQRFAIVAREIAKREDLSSELLSEVVEEYRRQNFFLDDLSCCDDECIC